MVVNHWVSLNSAGDGKLQGGDTDKPGLRGWSQASFDLETREMIFFGGSISTYMSDTWAYSLDKNLWHLCRKHPDLAGPCRRDNHNLVYDPVNKVHWLWNGISYDNLQPGCDRGMTWTYDRKANTWTKSPMAGWNGRLAAGAAYCPDRQSIFQTCGGAVNNDNRTFEFTIADKTWREVFTAVKPPIRTNIQSGFVYHKMAKKFVLFGGINGSTLYGDTWVLDPFAKTWTQKTPAISPPGRDLHCMVYDDLTGLIILASGRSHTGYLSDSWAYDLGKNTWTNITAIVGSPPAARDYCGIYDGQTQAVFFNGNVFALSYQPSASTPTPPIAPSGLNVKVEAV